MLANNMYLQYLTDYPMVTYEIFVALRKIRN